MAIGLSGDTISSTDGEQTAQLILIEQRVTNMLLQLQQGGVAVDSLPSMRNDEAFGLNITPFPISGGS